MWLTERLNGIPYARLASTLLYITNSSRVCSFGLISTQFFSLDAAPLSAQSSPSPSSSATRPPSVDNDQATREFIDFLKPLKYGREIFKQCRAFTESMAYKRVSFVGRIPDLLFPTSNIEQLSSPISLFPYVLRGNCCDLTKRVPPPTHPPTLTIIQTSAPQCFHTYLSRPVTHEFQTTR